jgi:hypothetical protein
MTTAGKGSIELGFHGGQNLSTQASLGTGGEVGLSTFSKQTSQSTDIVPMSLRTQALSTNKEVEIVVSVASGSVVMYVNGAEVVRGQEPSSQRGRGGGIFLQSIASRGDVHTIRITSFRIYAPSGAAGTPNPGGQCVTVAGASPCPQPGGLTTQRGAMILDVLQPNAYTVRGGATAFVRQPFPGATGGTALAATAPASGGAEIAINAFIPPSPPPPNGSYWIDIDYQYPQSKSIATTFFFRQQGGNAYSVWLLGGTSLALRYGQVSAGQPTDLQQAPIPLQVPPPPSGVASGSARMTIIVDGQQFTVLINNQQVLTASDSRLTSFDAGPALRVSRLGSAPNESGTILITNFQIYQLGTTQSAPVAGNQGTCSPARAPAATTFTCLFGALTPGQVVQVEVVRSTTSGPPQVVNGATPATVASDGTLSYEPPRQSQPGSYKVRVILPPGQPARELAFEVQ